ncbi:MAG: CCA tRNA nucleotidyltransferase [Longimicrobiales bacterium]
MTRPTPHPPGYVRWAAQTLEDAGYETWAVGGAIRNTLLGIPSGDWDLATKAHPKVVRRLFPRTIAVGIEHGTVGVLTREGTLLEITTFRKDIETFGRKAMVEFADTLEEDLSRRDFTVNAVAWHPLNGLFQDPFGGREDLERGLLRTVGEPRDRFSEDYLRVLRGLRFSGRFRLRIEDATWEALRDATRHLGILSPERIREELMKILAGDPRPSGALSLYDVSGVLEALYPEVAAEKVCLRPGGKENLLTHTLLLEDALPPHRPLLRLAVFFHGIGIPTSLERSDETDEKNGFERDSSARGRDRAAALMIRLRFSNADTRLVTELIGGGMEPPVGLRTPADLRRWLHRADPGNLASLARIWVAKARLDDRRWGRKSGSVLSLILRLRAEIRSGAPIRSEDLALTGRDLIALGMKPGPRFGEILEDLMERVLDEPDLNRPDLLREMALDRSVGEGSGGA